MVRLIALWGVFVAAGILLFILREERLVAQGRVPMGRLRRLWWRNERRRAPRYRVNWPVRYLRVPRDGPSLGQSAEAPGAASDSRGRTRDVSQTGAGLVVSEKLPAGAMLQIELNLPERPDALQATGEVIWTKEVPPPHAAAGEARSFFVGIRFRNLTPLEVSALGEALGGMSQDARPRVLPPVTPTVLAKRCACLPAGRRGWGTPARRHPWPGGSRETDPRAYARTRRLLWAVDVGVSFALAAFALLSGLAQQLSRWAVGAFEPWPVEVAVVVGLLWLALGVLTFPLDWLRGFQLEHRFGLSTQSLASWLKDYGKQLGLAALLGLILVEGLSVLLRFSPQGWWVWAALGWLIWTVGLTRVAPAWLIPLFYRQRPLEDPSLKQRLERLLDKCRTPVRGIFEINLSRTTRKANACLCGLGASRRVLLSDTLLAAHPADQVEVVLAHEVGHHRLHHTGILLASSALTMGVSCYAVDGLVRLGLAPLGLRGWSDPAALLLVGWGLAAAGLALMPVANGLSRRLEGAADRFALQATGNPDAFIAAMRQLAQQNLAEIDPPRWVEWFFYDHPSIARRIAMAEQHGRLHLL